MIYILPSADTEELSLEGALAGEDEGPAAGDGLLPLLGEGLEELPDPDEPEEEDGADAE